MHYEKIWQKTLNDSEKVEYEFSTGPKFRKFILIYLIVIGVLFLVAGLPTFGVLLALIGVFNYWRLGLNAYAFTSKRVLVHTGWLSTNSTSINYDKIVEVSVQESFLARQMGKVGNLIIKTGGFGHDIILRNIETPYEVKKTLDRLSHHQ